MTTASTTTSPAVRERVGTRRRRTEDPELLTGHGRYVEDLRVEQLRAVFVRSPMAHARITGIDTTGALAAPGVVGVWVAADLELPPLLSHPMLDRGFDRPPLATERVRFVGDPVAVVVAETRSQAVDAAEQVLVDYEPLEALVDPEAALRDGAVPLDPRRDDNEVHAFAVGGDEDPLTGADLVVDVRMVNQRVAAAPMETDGALVVPDPVTGGITVWASTQRVHFVRDRLAETLGMPPDRIRVVTPRVGGGFGAKFEAAPETVVTAAVAVRLGRAVAWNQTRSESMLTLPQGRGQVQWGRLGLDRDGTFVGLDVSLVGDAGAYPITGALIPRATLLMSPGPYRIARVRGRSRSALTNTTPVGAYRGAGRPEATALLERLVERAAAELGLDPVELRRRNLLAPDAYPHTSATGAVYDSGDYPRYLAEVTRRLDYGALRAEQARRREAGGPRQIGLAVCPWIDHTPMNRPGEYAAIRLEPAGEGVRVLVAAGTCDHGQAHQTTWGLVVSDVLGLPVDSVRLVPADTDVVPYGEGTGSARSLQLVGNAVREAALQLLDRAMAVAGRLLGAAPQDVVLAEGGHFEAPDGGIATWADVVGRARPDDGVLAVEHDFEQAGPTFPGGVHAAVVEVDVETGLVDLVRFVAVDDCGIVVNPVVVEGQQHGGIAQGVAQALHEQVVHDAAGNPVTGTFVDYTLPTAADLPEIEADTVQTRTPVNPLGAKGIGQGGAIGSTAAVHNAVLDALAHLGVDHVDMPCTPARVWGAITAAAGQPHRSG